MDEARRESSATKRTRRNEDFSFRKSNYFDHTSYYEGLQYEGRDLKIDLSEPRTGERTERPKPVRIPSENSVFVGNLGESIANVIPTFKVCNGNTRLPLKFECNYLSLTCYS